MSPDEIEAALYSAFRRCDLENCPLADKQKQILLQLVEQIRFDAHTDVLDTKNPLDVLSPEELQAFLHFVKIHEEQELSWKVQLLNDWLHNHDSGAVHFIRERYGLQWLNSIEQRHIQKYIATNSQLKIGDRIEVCNGLWEWVHEQGPCKPEWFPCTVIHLGTENSDNNSISSCIVRFKNGREYEIQGVYDWNRYNWRWAAS